MHIQLNLRLILIILAIGLLAFLIYQHPEWIVKAKEVAHDMYIIP